MMVFGCLCIWVFGHSTRQKIDSGLNRTRMTRIQRICADLVDAESATIRPIRVIGVLFKKMSCTVVFGLKELNTIGQRVRK